MRVWIFFGQSGAGKSFVGRVCAEELGFQHYDGDRDLTPEMLGALREHRVFTEDMRTEFVAVLSRGIHERVTQNAQSPRPNPGLAVSQGLFKTRARDQLRRDFPNARLVWVRASEELLETRLQQRRGHAASNAYARFVNGGFEEPAPGGDVLENDGDRARVVDQLKACLR
ncbi:MAG: AAA family ATPase [Pseudomonadota bacterium]